MKITFVFIGGMKFAVGGGKNQLVLDVPENATVADALKQVGVDCAEKTLFSFATVSGAKVDPAYVLKPGDTMKLFPRSFGG
jgi:hypothetical protein